MRNQIIFGIFCLLLVFSSCNRAVVVTQKGTTYHDYEAVKSKKIKNKTRKPGGW